MRRQKLAVILSVSMLLLSGFAHPAFQQESRDQGTDSPIEIIAEPISTEETPLEITAEPVESELTDSPADIPEIIAESIPLADTETGNTETAWFNVAVFPGRKPGPVVIPVAVLDDTAAVIDGSLITMSRFVDFARLLRYQYLDSYTEHAKTFSDFGFPLISLNDQFEDIFSSEGAEAFAREALDDLTLAEILRLETAQAGISFTEEEINDELASMLNVTAAEDIPLTIRDKFTGSLSEEFLRSVAAARLSRSLLFEQALEAHDFSEEMVSLSHIIVDTPESAAEIEAQIRNGGDWNELAQQYSLDTYTRDSGGDLGWVRRSDILSELADAAFALEPGQISSPIQTEIGWHILSSAGKEIRALEGSALEEAQNDYFTEWESELIAAHSVETFPEKCIPALPLTPRFIPADDESTLTFPADIFTPETSMIR